MFLEISQLTKKLLFILVATGVSGLMFLGLGALDSTVLAQNNLGPAHIQGRVVKNDGSWNCRLEAPDASRYYYGNFDLSSPPSGLCDESWCDGGSDFTIEWSQPQHGRNGSIRSNDCYGGYPNYNTMFDIDPVADEDGEEITIRVIMDDPRVKLYTWFNETTYSNRVRCADLQDGIFAQPGPIQTITTRIYKKGVNGECNWNNIWFLSYTAPQDLEMSCIPGATGNGVRARFSWTNVPQITHYKLKLDYNPLTGEKGNQYKEICCGPYDYPQSRSTIRCDVDGLKPNYNYIGWAVAASDGPSCLNSFEEGFSGNFSCQLTPSCTISIDDINIVAGSTTRIEPHIREYNGNVESVTFSLSDSDVASVCDSSLKSCPQGRNLYTDRLFPFDANLSGYNVGTTLLKVKGKMAGGPYSCEDTAQVYVKNPSPWWQVKGGDVVSAIANILSQIPSSCEKRNGCTPVFILDNPQNYPGVPSAGGTTNFGSGFSSSRGWDVDRSIFLGESFDYKTFERKIPKEVLSDSNFSFSETYIDGPWLEKRLEEKGVEYPRGSGYYWLRFLPSPDLKFSTNLTIKNPPITPRNLEDRRLILFVDGDLNINTSIDTDSGTSGFYAIVNGDINIDPSVGGPIPGQNADAPHIEGIFYADGVFSSGTFSKGQDNQLRIRGSVVASNFNLQRDITSNSFSPAEVFEFAPDLVLGWPPYLSTKNIIWKEISP